MTQEKLNSKRKSKKKTEEEKQLILQEYKTGNYSVNSLSKKLGYTRIYITKLLKENNIEIVYDKFLSNRKYTLNEHYFDDVDTEEKAYFLGLLYADGCVVPSRGLITLTLQVCDKYMLELFAKSVGSDRPLQFMNKTRKNKKTRQDAYRLELCSKHMCSSLIKLGCLERKSLILKFPTEDQVPTRLLRHFIRGYFDGDGSFGYYMKKHGYKELQWSVVSNIAFCLTLKEKLASILNIKINVSKQLKTTARVSSKGYLNVPRLMDWLYKNMTVFLERKYIKYVIAKNEMIDNLILNLNGTKGRNGQSGPKFQLTT